MIIAMTAWLNELVSDCVKDRQANKCIDELRSFNSDQKHDNRSWMECIISIYIQQNLYNGTAQILRKQERKKIYIIQ